MIGVLARIEENMLSQILEVERENSMHKNRGMLPFIIYVEKLL